MKPKRILALILSLAMIISTLPAFSLSAAAAETTVMKNIMLSIDLIEGGQAENVYFGQWDGYSIPWRVLDTEYSTGNQPEGGILVERPKSGVLMLSEYLMGTTYFDKRNIDNMELSFNVWETSTAEAWCKEFANAGVGDKNLITDGNGLAAAEASKLLPVTKTDPVWPDTNISFDSCQVTDDNVFFLSAMEVSVYFYGNEVYPQAYQFSGGKQGSVDSYWLRSPDSDTTLSGRSGCVNEYNVIISDKASEEHGARPALVLEPASILFTSAAEGGKPSGFADNAGAISPFGLNAVSDYDGSGWKLTLKDDSYSNFSINNNGILYIGTKLIVPYSGAKTGSREHISALIKDASGNVTYYGRLKNITDAADTNGTVEINLSGVTMSTGDTLYIFNEQYNGDKKTDYASELKAAAIPSGVNAAYVTFETNGGTINSGNISTYVYGTGATLPTDITKTGYTFGGWYENSNFSGNAVTKIGTTDTGNKTYYAKWTIDSYTVRLETNGGTINSNNVTEYKYGVGATLPTDITRDGYYFDGWYENSNFSESAVTKITSTETGNKEYFAKWLEKVTFTVENTEHIYQKDTVRQITVTPKDISNRLTAENFIVKYYEVYENNDTLKSTSPVVKTITSGKYLYVIDFATEPTGYGIERKYEVKDDTLPDISAYDNIGYMYINATVEQQKPIYFAESAVEVTLADTVTNALTNPNTLAATTFTSSNENVATVDADGNVTLVGAGTATIKAESVMEGTAAVYASYTLTVRKIPVTVSASDIELTYGDSFTEPEITISGGVTLDSLDGTLGFKTEYAAGKSVGKYGVTPNGLTSDVYNITYESGTITVTEKTLTADDFEITAKSRDYDGTNSADVTATVKAEALIGTDNLRAEIIGSFNDEKVGDVKEVSYAITSLFGKGFENYVLDGGTISGTVTANITPAKVTFFVSEETVRNYDGTVHKVDISAMALGNVFKESEYTVYYQAEGEEKTTEPVNVGEYTVIVELNEGNENYTAVQPTAKLIIEIDASARLHISGSNRNVTVDDVFRLHAYYGNRTPEVTWTSSDETVASIDEITGDVTILKSGTATITATITDNNYNSERADFELTAAKKRINIKIPASELVRNYTGKAQYINFISDDIDLAGKNVAVDATYVLLSDSSVNEPIRSGTYAVSYEVEDDRYIADGNTTLTINKATIVLKAADISKEYGEDPEYVLEVVSGGEIANAEELTAFVEYTSEGAAKTAGVGAYDIELTLTPDDDDNIYFTVSDTKGIMTVAKAPLTVKVKDVSREYGAENPTLEAEYTGFKNEETENTENIFTGTLALTYDEGITAETAVGEYADKTTASSIEAANYDITFLRGKVTITKIPVTASKGTARSSYLTVKFDKALAGLTAANFVVKNGEETITLTEVTASSDNKTYTLKGSFSTSVTYTVTPNITGTESDATHEITSEALSIKPSSSGGGGGGGGGGSSAPATHTVTFETNGGSEIDSVKVIKNNTVSEPTAPTKDGFTFDGWYTDKELTTTYDFDTKVTKNFTLYAKWTEDKTDETDDKTDAPDTPVWENPFTDVEPDDWFYEDVKYATENGLFTGTTTTTFAPNGIITRAMMVTVLYRNEGEPEVTGTATFEDVDSSAYYAKAVVWGQQNGIIKGYSETEFAPDQNITREQIAAIMHRYAQYKGYDVSVGENTNILSYTDFDSISEYAIDSMQYAVGSGLMKGKTETTLNPLDNATRAEIAAILHRFLEANK